MAHHLRRRVARTSRLLALVIAPVRLDNPAAEVERCTMEVGMIEANVTDSDVFVSTDKREVQHEAAQSTSCWHASEERRRLCGRLVASEGHELFARATIKARAEFVSAYVNDRVRPSYDIPPVYGVAYSVARRAAARYYQIDIDHLTNVVIDDTTTQEAMDRRLSTVAAIKVEMMELPAQLRMAPVDELIFNNYIDHMTTMMRVAQHAQIERMTMRDDIVRLQSTDEADAKAERRAAITLNAARGLAELRKKREMEAEQKTTRDIGEAISAEHRRRALMLIDNTDSSQQ